MGFRRKKVYGSYQTKTCPFCDRLATHKNQQGVDVCHKHFNKNLEEIKCLCGSWLEQCSGKFGPYFKCINCGNINFKKAMEIKEATQDKTKEENKPCPELSTNKTTPNFQKEKKEIFITSNDVEYFD